MLFEMSKINGEQHAIAAAAQVGGRGYDRVDSQDIFTLDVSKNVLDRTGRSTPLNCWCEDKSLASEPCSR